MPKHNSIQAEITTLRRALRRTRQALRRGSIDPIKGTRLLTQTSKALATLLNIQRRLNTQRQHEDLINAITNSVHKTIIQAARAASAREPSSR